MASDLKAFPLVFLPVTQKESAQRTQRGYLLGKRCQCFIKDAEVRPEVDRGLSAGTFLGHNEDSRRHET